MAPTIYLLIIFYRLAEKEEFKHQQLPLSRIKKVMKLENELTDMPHLKNVRIIPHFVNAVNIVNLQDICHIFRYIHALLYTLIQTCMMLVSSLVYIRIGILYVIHTTISI